MDPSPTPSEHDFRIRLTLTEMEVLEGAVARDLLARAGDVLEDTEIFLGHRIGGERFGAWAEANSDELRLFARLRRHGRRGPPEAGYAAPGSLMELRTQLQASASLGLREAEFRAHERRTGRRRRAKVPKRSARGKEGY